MNRFSSILVLLLATVTITPAFANDLDKCEQDAHDIIAGKRTNNNGLLGALTNALAVNSASKEELRAEMDHWVRQCQLNQTKERIIANVSLSKEERSAQLREIRKQLVEMDRKRYGRAPAVHPASVPQSSRELKSESLEEIKFAAPHTNDRAG